MPRAYVTFNPTDSPITLESGEIVPPYSFGASFYDRDSARNRLEEFMKKGLRVFRLQSPTWPAPRDPEGHPAVNLKSYADDEVPSTGREGKRNWVTAAKHARREPGGGEADTESAHLPPAPPTWTEVVPNRLYLAEESRWDPAGGASATIIVDLSRESVEVPKAGRLRVIWPADDDVDEQVLAGVVRLCAKAMLGDEQRIVLVGSRDAICTLSACVLREYLGLNGAAAMALLRAAASRGLSDPSLMETVNRYRPS